MQFVVSVPISMRVSIVIDAEDEKSAEAAAMDVSFSLDVVDPDVKQVTVDRMTRGKIQCKPVPDCGATAQTPASPHPEPPQR